MEDLLKLTVINKLKSVYRANSVGNRKESSAEHSWSCLILADYFLTKLNIKLNKEKVYELLMYHDMVEIYAGDSALHPELEHVDKKEREEIAANELKKALPEAIANKYHNTFMEYEVAKTPEAKFAKAIDSFDAILHEYDYKVDWKGWSKQFVINKKEINFKEFPLLLDEFHKIINHLEKEGYFNQ